jgi:hypothetical protein
MMHDCTLTGTMWESDMAENHHQPSTNLNLALSQTANGKDVLVEYDAEYEKTGHITRRAYLLLQNEKRIAEKKRPAFVSIAKANKLRAAPIEIRPEEDLFPTKRAGTYAVVSTNGSCFTLLSDGIEKGPYSLPTYLDARGRALTIALTPLTVTCDLALYTALTASVIGIFAAYAYCQSGSTLH